MRSRLLALAAGTFAIGVDAFVTAGLVAPVARDLDVSPSAAGQLVTVFALSYAVLSPVLAAATARFSRRPVLLAALALFVLGNVATALAPSYPLVLATRVVAAAGASMYTPNAAAVAAALAPPERRGRAMAAVMAGLTVANAIGVPLGTWVGGALGWRATLWLVAGLGAAALAGVALVVPDLRLPVPDGLRRRFAPLADRRVAAMLGLIMLLFAGFYALYTYLGPVLAPATGGDGGRLAVALWVFGTVSIGANLVGGRLADGLHPDRVRIGALAAFAVVVALVPLVRDDYAVTLLWAAVFGVPSWLQYATHLRLLVELAPGATPLLMGLNASAQYVGMGLGGALGGIALGAWGPASLGWPAAALVLGALAVTVATRRPRVPEPVPVSRGS
ncbi:MFS transporter [Actinomadura macrotermitis]|uniref:Purine efflux pump PbuE n=1 Tax=Actinomadura macrotermitis TaxID=2585200 RepID=A0A7K0BUC3_9ACTN|nr:MFS transporter [Actinomadura macrotermitis]MQY04727.1 Purine efflux pump PbuE [Actinomadura macrotermitis]